MNATKYSIGDKLHLSCFSDYSFEVEVEILAISNFVLANEHENILRKLFNSENAEIAYNKVKDTTFYYYICSVITPSINYKVGDRIVLCDALINHNLSYFVNDKFTASLTIDFNTINCSYRNRADIMKDLENFLKGKKVNVTYSIQKSADEQYEEEYNDMKLLINQLKSLKGAEEIVNKLLNVKTSDIGLEMANQLEPIKAQVDAIAKKVIV